MSTAVATLDSINFYIYVYVGGTELIIGTFGNVLTIVVFSQATLRSTRTAPTLIVLAILNTIYLNFAVTLRVIAGTRRQTDTTFGSQFLCHIFYFLLNSSIEAALTLLSWIAFDRYLCSCRQASRRAWSNRRVLQVVTLVIISVSLLINFPYLLLSDNVVINAATGKTYCSLKTAALFEFFVYFQIPVMSTIVPVTLLAVFGFLTIRNIRTVRQVSSQLERQMTRVLLSQTIIAAGCLVPYCTFSTIYSLATRTNIKTPLRVSIERLVGTVVMHVFYLLLGSGFYLYLIGSREVRRNLQTTICFWKRRTNRVLVASSRLPMQRIARKNTKILPTTTSQQRFT